MIVFNGSVVSIRTRFIDFFCKSEPDQRLYVHGYGCLCGREG